MAPEAGSTFVNKRVSGLFDPRHFSLFSAEKAVEQLRETTVLSFSRSCSNGPPTKKKSEKCEATRSVEAFMGKGAPRLEGP